MDKLEVPEYFICPISLEIMKDPVTAISGITYDRESIQRWLLINAKCPVTMHPLPTPRSDLITPNNTLLRLIQAWCSANDIPSNSNSQPPPTEFHVTSLIGDLGRANPQTKLKSLQKLEALASESGRNRVMLGAQADLTDSLVSFIVSCYEKRSTKGLREALSLFYLVRGASWDRPVGPLTQNRKIIESLLWVLGDHHDCFLDDQAVVKPYAAHFLRVFVERENPSTLGLLRPEFFKVVLSNLRPENLISQQGLISLLNVLLHSCLWGKNRAIMVGLAAVSSLVEVDIRLGGEKNTTELVLAILCHLCSCTDGRAQLVGHPSGISVVTRRILKVSPTTDHSAVFIIWLVSRYSATDSVLNEMVRVGTVAKLCMVMQGDCKVHLKEKAKEILMAHSDVWKGLGASIQVNTYLPGNQNRVDLMSSSCRRKY